MKNRIRVGTAVVATVGVVTAAALWTDALETGETDGGLNAAALPKTSECVGTKAGKAGNDHPDDSPLYRLLDHIDRLGAKRYAHSFTGLSVDQDDNAADLYRIPSAAFDVAVCAAAEKGVTVRLHDTDANRKDLDALADQVSEDMNRWDGTFQLREVGVDEQGWVHVGVDDPDIAEPIIHETFVKDREELVRVVHAGQAYAS